MSATTAKQCPVCMEKYTRVIRQPIECAYCPDSACRKCTSQYLLTTPNDPHCMHCKREWNREFIDLKLTKTFRKGPLKEHRRKVLMDRERARLPAMQVYVEAHHTIQEENQKISQLYLQKQELKRQKRKIQANTAQQGPDALIRALEPIRIELRKVREAMAECEKKRNEAHLILSGGEVKTVREFVMKCPADDCRGFLSSAWKCGTCQEHFCADCHAQKASHEDNTHVCNEDAKATASMIRKETRACPKCGIRIYKVEGCFAKNTPILRWDGHYSNSQDIKVGDVLVGDDGQPRIVEELCSGNDKMYEVSQNKGMTYVVNSKHKLALKFSGENSIHWSESENAWKVRWFDRNEHIMKSKKARVDENTTKDEAFNTLKAFCDTLNFDEVIEITVDEYMKLTDSVKKHLMGFKSNGIDWPQKDVPLDPYILGLWLGDGINDGVSFAANPEADPEILQYLLKWCEENKAELIHDAAYRFRIRRREVALGRLAIARGATSSDCKGCSEKKCHLCDLPNKPYTDEVDVGLRHPLKEILDKFNLPRKSKYIPIQYITNSREVRLQLLAGLIDTDGCLANNGKRVIISQSNHNLGKQIEYLALSLGFAVHVELVKKIQVPFPNTLPKDYPDHYRINISGEHLSEIPTRVLRKKCVDSCSTKDELRTSITVKYIGEDTYYGWTVSGTNRRFLLGDFTVARNCNQMWCTSCHTTFDWVSGLILLNTVVHNPHYYEYLRQKNNGVVPRELGDVPCGGLPNPYLFVRCLMASPEISIQMIEKTSTMLRSLNDIQHVRLPQFPIRQPANVNQDIDIRYLMKTIDEETWGRQLERIETRFEQRKEMGLILQTLIHVAAEKLTSIQNAPHSRRGRMISGVLKEIEDVRVYTNKSLIEKGNQMGIVVPQISDDWHWRWALKSEMKLSDKANEKEDEEGKKDEEEPSADEGVTTEENVFVDVGGEMVEMSAQQAREIFGV